MGKSAQKQPSKYQNKSGPSWSRFHISLFTFHIPYSPSSLRCLASISEGESIMTSRPALFLGKAM